MKYRTVVEITGEASSKQEAVDIAGEHLSGNFDDNIKMTVYARPVIAHVALRVCVIIALISTCAGMGLRLCGTRAQSRLSIRDIEHMSAFQPPLRTSGIRNFKNEWTRIEKKKALETIKE